LNYVFGEPNVSGSAALISLSRLRPEFYHETADNAVFMLRALKEAVHELGTRWCAALSTDIMCYPFFYFYF
jgi:archaemetzincin